MHLDPPLLHLDLNNSTNISFISPFQPPQSLPFATNHLHKMKNRGLPFRPENHWFRALKKKGGGSTIIPFISKSPALLSKLPLHPYRAPPPLYPDPLDIQMHRCYSVARPYHPKPPTPTCTPIEIRPRPFVSNHHPSCKSGPGNPPRARHGPRLPQKWFPEAGISHGMMFFPSGQRRPLTLHMIDHGPHCQS